MESAKRISWERRKVNDMLWAFEGVGIDVGAGREPVAWWQFPELGECSITRVDTWDLKQGDAHTLTGVQTQSYDFLFASHILEHLESPDLALENWVRVVKRGGTLLIAVPHQHLYEKKAHLPSRWNPRHLRFYQPDSFASYLLDASVELGFEVLSVQTGDWGWHPLPPNVHAVGEYQIDALLRKED